MIRKAYVSSTDIEGIFSFVKGTRMRTAVQQRGACQEFTSAAVVLAAPRFFLEHHHY